MKRQYGVRVVRSAALELERHPDAPRRQPWRAWAEEHQELGPIAVDLFAGAGGLSLGLENAGYTVVLSADHDPGAVQTHLANFPGLCLDLDMADPDRVDDLIGLVAGLDVDLIAGGPPCQPFSRAGRSKIRDLVDKGIRESVDPRRELWRPFLRVIETVRPRSVLMENVPDMALGDDMRTVRVIADHLERLGYETDMRILEARRYGVPQHRQRLFLVGTRMGVFEWPDFGEQVTLRDAISDLPALRHTIGDRVLRYRGPKSDFQARARSTMPPEHANSVFDHMTRAVRDDDREAFELMGKGVRYPDLPDHLKRYRDDIFDDKYNQLRWDDFSRSITAHIAKDGYWYIHPKEPRTLTVREAARIQTFPDDFRFSGSRSDAFRQIGNAVPPVLAESIAKALLRSASAPKAESAGLPSLVRGQARAGLLSWAQATPPPAWQAVGDPWQVLVGTIAGRGRDALASSILADAPTPERLVPQRIGARVRRASSDRERRVLRAVAKSASAIRKQGWDGGQWAAGAQLGPTDRQWVEVVGLGQKHIAATSGTLRVAARIVGSDEMSGVAARLVLARFVGHSEDSSAITAAMAGLGVELCTVTAPKCQQCPVASLCETANAAIPSHGSGVAARTAVTT
ncbi:MAG: DNA (cytosine-5-)-methyltransferase [Candidatus Nanopelagicales bacterium]|nr:DNA (cytosine-5-)-methyltransferase [Candidatus Nanopelagicales bacterium]